MKKLMIMLGAVAMSFGLFAKATPYHISFEEADGCTAGEALDVEKWTVQDGATATVVERTSDYDYNVRPSDERRTDLFEGANVNSLKLETGKAQVVCAPENVVDGIFFDQVVKFTGYEEDPEVTAGKIAVWMTAIETEGTEGEDGYDEGETNMYITCGAIDATGKITPTKINLGPADIDAWHRVTIKSLGAVTTGGVAGFLVYIDGTQVVSADAESIVAEAQLVDDATISSYNASGMLFPALEVGTVATVAYQGIGELDDVAIDEDGPKFTQFIEGTVGIIADATLVITAGGAVIPYDENGKFKAAPNSNLTLTYTAAEGKFLAPGGKQAVVYSDKVLTAGNNDFTDLVKDVEAKDAVAGVSSDEDYIYYASLQEAITAATGTEEFPAGVKLFADTAENVTVAADKYIELDMAGFTLNNKSNYYTIDNKGHLSIYDSRENVEDVADLAVIGFVKDVSWTYASSTIRNLGTLEISGIKVYNDTFIAVKNDEDLAKGIVGVCTLNGVVFDGADQSVQNWGTLTINGGIYNKVFTWAEPTCNSGYTEIYDGTFNDAVASVQQYNDTIGWSQTPATVKIYGGTFNEKVYGTYTTNFKGEDPERGTIEIYPADEEEIPGGIFAEANKPNVAYIINTPAEGYKNAWVQAEEEGYVTPGVVEMTTYAITIGTIANATLTIDGEEAANFEAVEDQEYDLAVTPATGYENATITFNGATIAAGKYKFTEAGTLAASAEAIKVTSITLDKEAVTIYVGGTSNVVATIAPAEALVQTVEWDYTALEGFATAQVEGNTIKITGTAAQPVSSSPMVIKAKADDVEVTCSISVVAVPTAGPTTDTPGADVEEQDIPGGKIAVVTTTDTAVKEVSISGLGETTTVQVNGQIDSIKGVGAGNAIKVVSRGDTSVDITEFCKIELSGDTATISLDPAKATPVIGEVTVDDKPVAPVSADGTVGVQTKPGLYYTLIAGNEPGAVTVEATEPVLATGTAMKLTADPAKFTPTGAKAFFKVDAAK